MMTIKMMIKSWIYTLYQLPFVLVKRRRHIVSIVVFLFLIHFLSFDYCFVSSFQLFDSSNPIIMYRPILLSPTTGIETMKEMTRTGRRRNNYMSISSSTTLSYHSNNNNVPTSFSLLSKNHRLSPNRYMNSFVTHNNRRLSQRSRRSITDPTTITTTSLSLSSLYHMLPKISNPNNIPYVMIGSGILALLLQLIIDYSLQSSSRLQNWFHIPNDDKQQKLKQYTSYTSHTIVAMIFMILISYIGIIGWWFHPIISLSLSSDSYIDRLSYSDYTARWLASVVTGVIILWDIPISLYIKELRKVDVILHHILMAMVSYTGSIYIPCYYIYFYFGVSELSSIPLLIYDQITFILSKNNNNGNQKEEESLIQENKDEDIKESIEGNNRYNTNNDNKKSMSSLIKLQDQYRIIVALSFTFIRAYLFTKVTLFQSFLPDVFHIFIQQTLRATPILPTTTNRSLQFLIISSMLFTGLQLYWFITKILFVAIQMIMMNKNEKVVTTK